MAMTTGAEVICVLENKKSSTSCKFPGDAFRIICHSFLLYFQISILNCLFNKTSLKNDSAALFVNFVVARPVE